MTVARSILAIFVFSSGTVELELSELSSPAHLVLGQSASLSCHYRLANLSLYSVKWYKNGQEFFRFMPSMDRSFEVFHQTGVTMDLVYSDSKRIRLVNINKESEGVYRCEVSEEYPNFLTVGLSVYLPVVALPSGPHITINGSVLTNPLEVSDSMDLLLISCSVVSSRPSALLTWYVNRELWTLTSTEKREKSDGTVDITSSIELPRRRQYFEGELRVKCSAHVRDFFLKSQQLRIVNTNLTRKQPGRSLIDEIYISKQRQRNLNTNNSSGGKQNPNYILPFLFYLLLICF